MVKDFWNLHSINMKDSEEVRIHVDKEPLYLSEEVNSARSGMDSLSIFPTPGGSFPSSHSGWMLLFLLLNLN